MDMLFIASLVYLILIATIFFSKKKIKNIDTRVYSTILIVNMFGLVLDYLQIYLAGQNVNSDVLILVNKIFLIYVEIWTTIFALYVLNIERGRKRSPVKSIGILLAIFCLIVIILPESYSYTVDGNPYVDGPAVLCTYLYVGILIMIMFLSTIKKTLKNSKIKKVKFIPLFAFVVLGSTGLIVQLLYPQILLTSPVETFITILTYFFIENPDVKLIEQLNIAREQAERANNAKSDFLSNMSHEIRTPLNAIVGFSQALSEEENVPEEAKDEIKDIMMASQNLLEIVNGILDISKIEANKLEIVNTEYSLKNVLEELTALTQARIGEKPITLRTVFDPSIPAVLYGDYVRLKQIVLNLLTNAAKYTKEGYIEFKVDFVIKEDICRLIISVEDTGIGIKKENIDKLFNKFERLDLEKNITIEGTGLGLAITKKLVELMNGNIVVQSEYGNGSKFTVAIDQRIVEGKESADAEVSGAEVEIFDASDKKILLVDDNKINLKVAARLLQNYNVQVDQATSGEECIEKVKQGIAYDLILLDDMMPKMSGVETLKELLKIEGYQIPTIAFTANAITGMKEKYLKDGFNDYLSKPIDKLELNHLLVKYLKEGEK